jgi:hypothetical protein
MSIEFMTSVAPAALNRTARPATLVQQPTMNQHSTGPLNEGWSACFS